MITLRRFFRFPLCRAVCLLGLVILTPGTVLSAPHGATIESDGQRDIAGFWEVDSSHGNPKALVRMDGYHGHYSGTVVRLLKPDAPQRCEDCDGPRHDQPIVGMEIIWGLTATDQPGHYRDGQILDPQSGDIYHFKATVSPNGQTLKGRGYIGFSLLGKTQTWQRRDASALQGASAQ